MTNLRLLARGIGQDDTYKKITIRTETRYVNYTRRYMTVARRATKYGKE